MNAIRASGIARMHPVELRSTFALQAFGAHDPTAEWAGETLTKSFSGPNGACTVTISRAERGLLIEGNGVDAESVVAEFVASAESDDGYSMFLPSHLEIAKLHRQSPGLRLVRVPWLFDIACSAVLQQRVRSSDAMRDWGHIAKSFGERVEDGLVAFPSARTLSEVPLHDLIRRGIDPRRARALLALAREIRLYPFSPSMSREALRLRLSRIPGVGPWTTEMVMGFGAGDPDAVPIGDLYLPHLVAFALARENRGTDERMLELLEPFRPQRFRVIRLIYTAKISVPGWRDGRS